MKAGKRIPKYFHLGLLMSMQTVFPNEQLYRNYKLTIITLNDKSFFLISFKVFDATGKIQTEALAGNLIWYGSYDECKRVQAVISPKNESVGDHVFNGQYCNAYIPIVPKNPNTVSNFISLVHLHNLFDCIVVYSLNKNQLCRRYRLTEMT